MVDWSDLPWPALSLISEFLTSPVDYIRLRSVCRSWRSAVPKRPHLPLLVGSQTELPRNVPIFFFLDFTGSDIPPIDDLPDSNLDRYICGSSHGWLILLDRNPRSLSLWNPITQALIQLPPPFDDDCGLCSLWLSSCPSLDPECVVLMEPVYFTLRRLAFCRIRDDVWTPIPCPDSLKICDIMFYDGRFYLACGYDIYVWNVGALGCAAAAVQRIPAVDSTFDAGPSWTEEVHECYFIESCGDLLLATFWDTDYIGGEDDAIMFEVFKLDLRDQRVKLMKMDSLGDRALFLGWRSRAVSVCATSYPGCSANCIYMTRRRHIRTYFLNNGKDKFIDRCVPRLQSELGWCVWVAPTLL